MCISKLLFFSLFHSTILSFLIHMLLITWTFVCDWQQILVKSRILGRD